MDTIIRVHKKGSKGRVVTVINDELTTEEKNKIKYAFCKKTNASYKNLVKYLPKIDEDIQC